MYLHARLHVRLHVCLYLLARLHAQTRVAASCTREVCVEIQHTYQQLHAFVKQLEGLAHARRQKRVRFADQQPPTPRIAVVTVPVPHVPRAAQKLAAVETAAASAPRQAGPRPQGEVHSCCSGLGVAKRCWYVVAFLGRSFAPSGAVCKAL